MAGDNQLARGGFQLVRQLLKAGLLLPDVIGRAGLSSFLDLREVLPRLVSQGIQLDRALSKARAVEGNPATQHAAQLFAGLEHLLENRFTLAQRRIGINPTARSQRQAGQHYNSQSFKSHGGFRSRKSVASILASPAKTNTPIEYKDCLTVIRPRQTSKEPRT